MHYKANIRNGKSEGVLGQVALNIICHIIDVIGFAIKTRQIILKYCIINEINNLRKINDRK